VGDFSEDGYQDSATANETYNSSIAILPGNWKEIDIEIGCDRDSVSHGENISIDVVITNETDSTLYLQS